MKSYLKMHDKLPLRLIFFRDGVSEGQFSQVCLEELAQIKSTHPSLEVTFPFDVSSLRGCRQL